MINNGQSRFANYQSEHSNITLRNNKDVEFTSLRKVSHNESLKNKRIKKDSENNFSVEQMKTLYFKLIKNLSSSDPRVIEENLRIIHNKLYHESDSVAEDLLPFDILTKFSDLLNFNDDHVINHAAWCLINLCFSFLLFGNICF